MRAIVCLGDSVTQGTPHVHLQDTFPKVLERRLNMRAVKPDKVRCVNSGVGGENTAEGLARIRPAVLDHKPELVVVEFGLNDIRYEPEKHIPADRFKANLREMHARITRVGARVVFTTPNPIILAFHGYSELPVGTYSFYDRWGGVNEANMAYAQAVREVAAESGAPLCDVYRAFEDKAIGSEFRGECGDWRDLRCLAPYINSADGVHPTVAGQALIAGELYKVIVREGIA